MKVRKLSLFCHSITAAIVWLTLISLVDATHAQEVRTNAWHPDTKKLNEAAKYADPVTRDAASTLAHDVTNFYQLLRDKKWHETYDLRAKAFREDVRETDYLGEATKYEDKWGLVNYEVLSVGFSNTIGSTNVDQAVLICRFIELPDYAVSYSSVFWHREDGVWKCLSAGPRKLGIFRQTRPPIIDWR